jgi:hypothetical protein
MFSSATTHAADLKRLKSRERRHKIGQLFMFTPIAELLADTVRELEPATVLDSGAGGGILLRATREGPKLFGLDIDAGAMGLSTTSMSGEHKIAVDATRRPYTSSERALLKGRYRDESNVDECAKRDHQAAQEGHRAMLKHYSSIDHPCPLCFRTGCYANAETGIARSSLNGLGLTTRH